MKDKRYMLWFVTQVFQFGRFCTAIFTRKKPVMLIEFLLFVTGILAVTIGFVSSVSWIKAGIVTVALALALSFIFGWLMFTILNEGKIEVPDEEGLIIKENPDFVDGSIVLLVWSFSFYVLGVFWGAIGSIT